MTTCKCGKEFHACSNCYLEYNWEYQYCSKSCYHSSTEYKENHQRCLDVVCLLDRESAQKLLFVIDSEYMTAELYALLRDKVLGNESIKTY